MAGLRYDDVRFGRDSGRGWSTSCTAVGPVALMDDPLVDRKARNYNIGGHRYSGGKTAGVH